MLNNKMINDKRGQGLSVNAIILIVLGVVVLALLILGFSVGWSKVLPFISKNNVNGVVTACQTACTTQSQYDFCTAKRELKTDTQTLNDVTCGYLAAKMSAETGISSCGGITCDSFNYDSADLASAGSLCSSGKTDNGNAVYEGIIFQFMDPSTDTLLSYKCTNKNLVKA